MMRVFDYLNAPCRLLTPEMVQMISRIHEYHGRQELMLKSCEQELQKIHVKKRQEEEDPEFEPVRPAEYDDLYEMISTNYQIIHIYPKDILQFHRKLYASSGRSFGGHYREAFNKEDERAASDVTHGIDIERKKSRKKNTGYVVRAAQVEECLESLCEEFNIAWEDDRHEKLLLIPMFIIDFINIHPFDNGNEKISRLLIHLMLCKAGYPLGNYIDLDQLIDKSVMTYYNVMEASSENWNEANDDYTMFTAFFLSLISRAYSRFEHLIHKTIENRHILEMKEAEKQKEQALSEAQYQKPPALKDAAAKEGGDEFEVPAVKKVRKLSKPDKIRQLIDAASEKITKKDIMATFPDISKVTVERTLTDLVKNGYIIKVGGGPSTAYVKAGSDNE